jgi:hypothetical protein
MGERRGIVTLRDDVMLRGETTSKTFSAFVEEHEARLRHALTARFGSEVGKEAAADALAYGWEHWETTHDRRPSRHISVG